MRSTLTLDERYLAFNARTGGVFLAHPQLEPLRQFVFKQLVVCRRTEGWWGAGKHWLRPLVRRERTDARHRADVLVWIESRREVIVEALLPVYRELLKRDIAVALVASAGPAALPEGTLRFRFPARAVHPPWARGAWEALCQCEPALRNEALRRSFLRAAAMLEGLREELRRMLTVMNPVLVLGASTQLIGGAALMAAARSQGATSLLLQHGILQAFYTPLLADLMLTWGPTSDETLVSLGASRERLLAVGSPRHDAMGPLGNGRARVALLRALALPDRPTFAFFSNGNDMVRNGTAPAECAQWLEAAAVRYAGELNIVVRLHPNEDGALYRRCRHLTVTDAVPDLATTLDGCDWIGSVCSTVLYDGLLYGKPVWQFSGDGWPVLADNWQRGLARRVSSEEHLHEMVGAMLARGAESCVDESLVARVFANHGQAGAAAADVISSRLGDNRAATFVEHSA